MIAIRTLASLSLAALATACASPGATDAAPAAGMPPGMSHGATPMPMAAMEPRMKAMKDMHQKMMAAQGANAGETWVRKMIEHHRGAVEMSQIALRSTQNADVRREAQKTIASQNREIATLNAMLRKMGKPAQ